MPTLFTDLEDFVNRIIRSMEIKRRDNPKHEDTPFYLIAKEGQLMADEATGRPELHVPGANRESLEQCSRALRLLSDVIGSDTYAFCYEAWTSITPLGDQEVVDMRDHKPEVMPVDDPNREEAMVIFSGNREGEVHNRFLKIHRDENGNFTHFEDRSSDHEVMTALSSAVEVWPRKERRVAH